MKSIDTLISSGKSDVQGKLTDAQKEVQKMGDAYQEVKDGLEGMPNGIESDIAAMIEAAKAEGKAEAEADIEGVKSSLVADAKSAADNIKSDVTQKISDNTTAKGKIEGISSKYGKSAMDRAAAALDENTQKGNDLMRMLEEAIKDADQDIEGVKGRL